MVDRVAAVQIEAELIGRGHYDSVELLIVRCLKEMRPEGPAENALLAIEQRPTQSHAIGRYISWIGYYDVDRAIKHEPERWKTVEPAIAYNGPIVFEPYRKADGSLI